MDLIRRVQPDAIVREFTSLAEWTAFTRSVNVYDRSRLGAIAERAAISCVHGLYTGSVAGTKLVANGLDMRRRAVLDIIAASQNSNSSVCRTRTGIA